ncbi:hypothetical protein HDV00_002669 [Rhizophlyctis rosea]|nr:hypothetical protein HDV00_002669 [Rhizophlyctis rosea]
MTASDATSQTGISSNPLSDRSSTFSNGRTAPDSIYPPYPPPPSPHKSATGGSRKHTSGSDVGYAMEFHNGIPVTQNNWSERSTTSMMPINLPRGFSGSDAARQESVYSVHERSFRSERGEW